MRALILLAAWLGLIGNPSGAMAESEVASPQTEIQGVLCVGEFYGPPNYGENPKSDVMEKSIYLQMPITLQGNFETGTAEFEMTSENDGGYFLQLVVSGKDLSRAKELIGRKVLLNGRLFAATTGHHRTPFLLEVVEIRGVLHE